MDKLNQEITVLIVTFFSKKIIEDCLKKIDQKYPIVIVENSKDQNFKFFLENNFKNVKCILAGKNLGYGKANNIGLKAAKTKYALILNPDVTLETTTLLNFFNIIKRNPDFAIIGPFIQEIKDKEKIIETQSEDLILVKNVKGFAMFLKISEFEKVGFFDENFFLYFEEIDLCRRLIKNNKKIYLSSEIKVNHLGGKSHKASISHEMELSRNWHWMWSTFYYNKKYSGYIISFLNVFPKLILSIIRFFLYTLLLNKKKREIYLYRYLGLINAILGRSSWYRPKV